MKILDLYSDGDRSYEAHLVNDTAYLYINDVFEDMLHIEGIEHCSEPIPTIIQEIELLCKPSLQISNNLLF